MKRSDSPAMNGTGSWRTLLTIALATLAIRGGVAVVRRAELRKDPDAYRQIAENLRGQGVYGRSDQGIIYPTAYRPPLYPLILAGISRKGRVAPVMVGVLHVLLGTATVCLTYLLARQWQLGRRSSWVAFCVALDPILINQSTLVMTETLATFLAVLALICLTRAARRWSWRLVLVAGSVLGLASLCRPTFLVWLALVALTCCCHSATAGQRVCRTAILVGAALAVLLPWLWRNYQQFDEPIWATTHGGYTLLLGNNPYFYRHLREAPAGTVWDARELQRDFSARWVAEHGHVADPTATELAERELRQDEYANELAQRYIQDEPQAFVRACLIRVWRLWRPLPYALSKDESVGQRLARYAVCGWYALTFLLAATGVIALRRRLLAAPWLWGLLLCAAFTVVHTFYWSNLRMRAPLMPFVYLLCGAGAAWIGSLRDRRK